MKVQDKVIQGKDVCIGYRTHSHEIIVHNELNFTLYAGEMTCLLGSNGSGKSTLLRTLAGMQPALGGDIRLLNKRLQDYSEKERSRTIGVVLTEKSQAGGLTVRELVSLGRQPHTGFFGRLNARDQAVIDYAIQAVGIPHLSSKYIAELSDGERQKAFIAKALVQECPLILLDEPTAFLDVVSRIEIMSLLRKLAKEENKAFLLSTHDIDQALLLSDRLWLLSKEKGLTSGVTEDLILSDELEHLFPQDNIYFDAQKGSYSPRTTFHRSICLQAESDMLRHWGQNALNRWGYHCIFCNASQEGLPFLLLQSPYEAILSQDGNVHKVHSFEELQALLR